MNASMRVLTPEEKWHAGRQADAFFGLLDQYNKLLEDHNKLKEENVRLRNIPHGVEHRGTLGKRTKVEAVKSQ
jgi:cupin superfamily acireductone dioxygenase involved in methionine salvage